MQTPTIEKDTFPGITEVPGTEFAFLPESSNEKKLPISQPTPHVEKVSTVEEKEVVNDAPVAQIGIGYELGVIGEITGKGLPSDLAREAIGSKVNNLPLED